jgi:hypothetical protein
MCFAKAGAAENKEEEKCSRIPHYTHPSLQRGG